VRPEGLCHECHEFICYMTVRAFVLMHSNLGGVEADTTLCWDRYKARWTGVISNCKGRYTLSVKLSDFT